MRVETKPVEMKKPLDEVVITMTNEEAQKLRAIFGNIGGPYCGVRKFMETMYTKLCPICSKEGQILTFNHTEMFQYSTEFVPSKF